jgi:hypothetical protein
MDAQKSIKYIMLAVVLGNVALMAFVFLGSPTPKPTPMPNPNGYVDFLKAAPLLNGKLDGYKKMDREALATAVGHNAPAWELLETGVKRDSRVAGEYVQNPNGLVLMPVLSAWRQAGFLFCAQGTLAELDGRTNDAVHNYMDGIQFSEKCGRGGILIEKLVSAACESAVGSCLDRIRPSLTAKQCAEVARGLEAIDTSAESDQEILDNESAFEKKYNGVGEKLAKLVTYRSVRASINKAMDKIHAGITRRRQMMLSFAARAYELDKGKRPANIADLVPDYLKKIPQDPATGTNLVLIP